MIRVLNLSGSPHRQGQQHGEQVADLRPKIQDSMRARLAELRLQSTDVSLVVNEVARSWEQHASGTLEMLRGMGEALQLDWGEFFTYTIASFLGGRLKQAQPGDGCTTWAAGRKFTCDGAPLLAKNRDTYPDHQTLQCLARVQPERGYPYLCLTSAGSPGVFSSGINSPGLAVADTYVASCDMGLGIARYSLMMDLLEKYASVQDAIPYLYNVPHFGDGTVILADAQGDLAVFELAHSVQAVRRPAEGFLVSTNHFSASQTRTRWVDTGIPQLHGNSQARRQHVEAALLTGLGQVDVQWAQTLMAQHDDGLCAICRHPEMESNSMTISTAIFLPRQACLYVANGLPCQTLFELHHIDN
jgi:hypothetical protein